MGWLHGRGHVLKRLKDPMWVEMARMAIRIALLIATRLARNCLAMPLKGGPGTSCALYGSAVFASPSKVLGRDRS